MESQILQITHRRERKLEAAILQNIYLLQLGHALKLFNVVVTNYAVNDGVYPCLELGVVGQAFQRRVSWWRWRTRMKCHSSSHGFERKIVTVVSRVGRKERM